MRNRWLKSKLIQWLPAYASGSVTGFRRLILDFWLDHTSEAQEELAFIEKLRAEIRQQPQLQPSTKVYLQLHEAIFQAEVPAELPRQRIVTWAATVIMALIALVLIWQAFPPGIILEWSVQGEAPSAFRVYRAPVAADASTPDQSYKLLEELPADDSLASYQFTDWLPLPGQEYVYRVDALNSSGQPTVSQTVNGRGLDALVGQLLVLVGLGILLGCILNFIRTNLRAQPLNFRSG